jgi:hypothetical protein
MFSVKENSFSDALINRVLTAACLFFVLLSHSEASAQSGKDTMLWEWTPRGDHHNAIVSVHSGNGSGTGVVIKVDKEKPIRNGFEGWCLTASHVVSDDDDKREIKVEYQNGKRAKRCKVIRYDAQHDLALLWVWVPAGTEAVDVAETPVELGHTIEFAGLGGNSDLKCCIRHFVAKASVSTNPNQLFADAPLLPGDSGGPVFNDQQELTGIISGGWFWLTAKKSRDSDSDDRIRVTWPARAGNLGAIVELLNLEQESRSENTDS